MKCSKCYFDNKREAKFCKKCGTELKLICQSCGHLYERDSLFCEQCGRSLEEFEQSVKNTEGERKYITVLFSDLSGYTALCEKLDPEETKDLTNRIFKEIGRIIAKYEGFIEKFIGDAAVALFGVPTAHEDDPIRAIKVAMEIHEIVEELSPELEEKIGQSISMHSGVNTGLVVTGELDMERGKHGVAGDTINVASRISCLAKAGEIFVGYDTYRQAEGYFTFEALEPMRVKGKADPIKIYRLVSPKEKPTTIRRLSGLRAELIGRKAEIALLREAVEYLKQGKGKIFSICGDAGAGKSRLVDEFKSILELQNIQWIEGHAYAYSQNIPYFPLIDLLNRVLKIEEDDPQERLRDKVESGIVNLVNKSENVVPYIGSLYSLAYSEIEGISPDFWKSCLKEASLQIIAALAQRAPTVFFLEDLHWADHSFIDLLRQTLFLIRQPAIFLCAYRPNFSLFTTQQLKILNKSYEEIRLNDFSLSETQDMLESLLKTEKIPSDLKRFVRDKAEGNPFYLEELVNSLIESDTLVFDHGRWIITKPMNETQISSTIHGLISGRLDRLDRNTKRVIQEASVIGRAFLYEVLKRITELKEHIDQELISLERLDLIRNRQLQQDLEYIFKHALTQEVVYNGLLKSDRRTIHERIATVMEQLFKDRLPEFYEAIAYHFSRGKSVLKSVDYLMKSGIKCLKRYSLEESHQHFNEAYEIISEKTDKSNTDNEVLIEILNNWAYVFYFRGDFKGLRDLFATDVKIADSITDKEKIGMFYGWTGFSLRINDQHDASYKCLINALNIGEEAQSLKVIGLACAWLSWTCGEIGLFSEAISFAERAQKIAKTFEHDHYLNFKSFGGMAQAYIFKGDLKKAFIVGKSLLEYGQKNNTSRSIVLGYVFMGYYYFMDGDFSSSIECLQKAIQISVDPYYSICAQLLLCFNYIYIGKIQDIENIVLQIESFCLNFGCEIWGTLVQILLGMIAIYNGKMNSGLKLIKNTQQKLLKHNRKYYYAYSEYILGKIYSKLYYREEKMKPAAIIKNIGFLLRNVPFASKNAEAHFKNSIEAARNIQARAIQAQSSFDLGILYKTKRKKDAAHKCLSEAVRLFKQCEATTSLKIANEAFNTIF
jgi:predicted ATPase/class 3 adenylate cyclase